MNKRVIIIHGWGEMPQNDWLPWAKKELESRGYEVMMPSMPDGLHPKIETWVPYLKEVVEETRKGDVFIGCSIGGQTILRYLEHLEDDKRVEKVILVAPWVSLTEETYEEEGDREIAEPWLNTLINFEKVKTKAESFIAIFSDNDPYVPIEENKAFFEETLGARIIIEHNKGHFTEDDGVKELPMILDLI